VRRRGAGISLLLEVILGLGLFSITLLLLFALFPSSQRALVQSKNYAQANGLAREIMEQERTKQPFSAIVDLPAFTRQLESTTNGVASNTTFVVTSNVTDLSTTAGGDPFNMKGVRVTVRWEEGWIAGNIVREAQLETFVIED